MKNSWYICLRIDTDTKKVLGAQIFSERNPTCMRNIRYFPATELAFDDYDEAKAYLKHPMFDWIGEVRSNSDSDRIWRGSTR
jgi:hypothetical protein